MMVYLHNLNQFHSKTKESYYCNLEASQLYPHLCVLACAWECIRGNDEQRQWRVETARDQTMTSKDDNK